MNAVRLVVRSLGELFITLGVLLLLFLTWQLFWTDVTADRAQANTVSQLERDWAHRNPGGHTGSTAPAIQDQLPGNAFALVRIPRFGSDYVRPVVSGTSLDLLKQGIGHYAGTAMPGQVGNFAMAGHRTTYGKPFNQIADLVDGDAVVVETADSWFVYRVVSHEIVAPTAVQVIDPVPDKPGEVPTQKYLTMTACHPMFSAAQRYVVHAVLESQQARTAGPPAALTQPLAG